MPRYYNIKFFNSETRKHTLQRLLNLREELEKQIPLTKSDSLLLASWNIRDFDSNKFGHGPRLEESYYYMAEIISRFDLVAVQEINRDLNPLKKLMFILGSNWDYIITGVTEGMSGNEERMAFLYNKNRVDFTHLAGQVVLPRTKLISTEKDLSTTGYQFARAPYVASFQSGWFKFNLCTVHIYFGSDSGQQLERRIDEINKIASHFKSLNEKEPGDYILLGDFNIVSPQHKTMEALLQNGFTIPEVLQNFKTNLAKNKYYDQIAFRQKNKQLMFGKAGVFDFRDAVYNEQDFEYYYQFMPLNFLEYHTKGKKKGQKRTENEKRDYYNKEWITWQMSDHILLWVELKVDFTNDYLKSLMPGRKPLIEE